MKFKQIFKNIGNIPKNIYNKFINLFDTDDRKAIKLFSLEVILWGSLINFMLLVIIHQTFTWYSWIGWGVLVKVVELKIIPWFRRLWFKS